MTAIIGYIGRKDNKSIGVLSADDLEGWSKCKVDKLSKLSDRFVVGVIGLESVHWLINYVFEYFESFSGSSKLISSIEEFEARLSEAIPNVFKKWADEKLFDNIPEQFNIESEIVVLDLQQNNLYYADLGKVWQIYDPKKFRVKFILVEDGLTTFGVAVGDTSLNYRTEKNNINTKEEAWSVLNNKFQKYKLEYPGLVGDIGATEINILGENKNESFTSCFSSYTELIDNLTKRQNSTK